MTLSEAWVLVAEDVAQRRIGICTAIDLLVEDTVLDRHEQHAMRSQLLHYTGGNWECCTQDDGLYLAALWLACDVH